MGLLDWISGISAHFRALPPIDTRDKLIEFLDTRSAFLIQKNIFDYARARSGPYFKVMVSEPEFQRAVEIARWSGYPVGLAALAEIVRGVLFANADRKALNDAVSSAALAAFDKYLQPEVIDAETWKQARETLILRLSQINMHPPKFVKDIILPYSQLLYDSQPIHEQMRKSDFGMIESQLRVNLINMHDQFEKAVNTPALLSDLGVHANSATAA
jgi:hypothetical protein